MTRAKDISKILTDADISGNIDVDGVTNLDVVDIDGAVDMASTALVTGVLTANGGAVFNEGSADVDFRVESNITTNALFVDGATGVLGVGVTPQTDWTSAFEVIQYGQAGVLWANNNDNSARLGMNVKYDGAYKYINTNKAVNLTLDSVGQFVFDVAASGSADSAITWTTAMKIHNNGVVSAPLGVALGVGTANTASNVISDFETGSWTPSFTNVNASATSGTYTKIGNYVFCTAVLQAGGASGDNITGQPFTALRGTGSVGYHNQNSTESWNVIIEATHINLYHGAGARALTSTQIAFISFSYRTA